MRKVLVSFHPILWGAHRYTTASGGVVRPPGAPGGERCAKDRRTWGSYTPPPGQKAPLPPCRLCVQPKAKERLLPARKVYVCHLAKIIAEVRL